MYCLAFILRSIKAISPTPLKGMHPKSLYDHSNVLQLLSSFIEGSYLVFATQFSFHRLTFIAKSSIFSKLWQFACMIFGKSKFFQPICFTDKLFFSGALPRVFASCRIFLIVWGVIFISEVETTSAANYRTLRKFFFFFVNSFMTALFCFTQLLLSFLGRPVCSSFTVVPVSYFFFISITNTGEI